MPHSSTSSRWKRLFHVSTKSKARESEPWGSRESAIASTSASDSHRTPKPFHISKPKPTRPLLSTSMWASATSSKYKSVSNFPPIGSSEDRHLLFPTDVPSAQYKSTAAYSSSTLISSAEEKPMASSALGRSRPSVDCSCDSSSAVGASLASLASLAHPHDLQVPPQRVPVISFRSPLRKRSPPRANTAPPVLMSPERIVVLATMDAESYIIVELVATTSPSIVRECLLAKLNICDPLDQGRFLIYQTEIGASATSEALSDNELSERLSTLGDDRGTLKFLISHLSVNVHDHSPILLKRGSKSPDERIILVTADSERYITVPIAEAKTPKYITEWIFTKASEPILQFTIFDKKDQMKVSIYEMEIGAGAPPCEAISERKLFELCKACGDAKGTLKFLVVPSQPVLLDPLSPPKLLRPVNQPLPQLGHSESYSSSSVSSSESVYHDAGQDNAEMVDTPQAVHTEQVNPVIIVSSPRPSNKATVKSPIRLLPTPPASQKVVSNPPPSTPLPRKKFSQSDTELERNDLLRHRDFSHTLPELPLPNPFSQPHVPELFSDDALQYLSRSPRGGMWMQPGPKRPENRREAALSGSISNIRRGFLAGEGSGRNWLQQNINAYYKYDKGLVQELANFFQEELDSLLSSATSDLSKYQERCLQALLYISKSHFILPSSFILKNIQKTGSNSIAGGGFSDIWQGLLGEQCVCLKVLRLTVEPDEDKRGRIRKQFCNEALLWRQLKHPNILTLLGVNIDLFYPSFCLISPWMVNRDIVTYLKRNPEHNRHNVLLEIANGLSYLHSREPSVVHGDIRGANILVTNNLRCCLADFGLARVAAQTQAWSNATSTPKGAVRWMAPELFSSDNSKEYDCSRDIYAFGCTIIEVVYLFLFICRVTLTVLPFPAEQILSLKIPFPDLTDYEVLFSVAEKGTQPGRPQNVWCPDPIWELTTRCLARNPNDRPSAQKVYEDLYDMHHEKHS
ncbi:hypothetical protein D9757_009771 [Collybiopsis confluens]|uniref:Protein kinase domain-containing protein n=1 Tax=Collybiopsis confluens TaxID=2823264 RepID=A0A8H5GY61_9AGAR|nr:hypothetical protein D9757_009771 [Collybiopsis confluens]